MRTHRIEGVRNGQVKRTTLPGLSRWPPMIWCAATSVPVALMPCGSRTYLYPHWEGWSYLAVILDVHTRRIVGWQLASHMRQSLVSDALEMAIASRKERGQETVAHSACNHAFVNSHVRGLQPLAVQSS